MDAQPLPTLPLLLLDTDMEIILHDSEKDCAQRVNPNLDDSGGG